MIRKEGDRLVLEPVRKRSLLALLASWEPMPYDWPEMKICPRAVDLSRRTDSQSNNGK